MLSAAGRCDVRQLLTTTARLSAFGSATPGGPAHRALLETFAQRRHRMLVVYD